MCGTNFQIYTSLMVHSFQWSCSLSTYSNKLIDFCILVSPATSYYASQVTHQNELRHSGM